MYIQKRQHLCFSFTYIYKNYNYHGSKHCNVYISCSDLKKNKNVICFHDQGENYPLLSISPFPDETDSTGCLTEEHVSFNDIATSRHQDIPQHHLEFRATREKNPKRTAYLEKKKPLSLLWLFYTGCPYSFESVTKMFPPSELKVSGSNLGRFSLFIFYDRDGSWYFSCVYIPFILFSYNKRISMKTYGESSVNLYRRAQE